MKVEIHYVSKYHFVIFQYTHLDKMTQKIVLSFYENNYIEMISLKVFPQKSFRQFISSAWYIFEVDKKVSKYHNFLARNLLSLIKAQKKFCVNELSNAMNMKIHISLNEQIECYLFTKYDLSNHRSNILSIIAVSTHIVYVHCLHLFDLMIIYSAKATLHDNLLHIYFILHTHTYKLVFFLLCVEIHIYLQMEAKDCRRNFG